MKQSDSLAFAFNSSNIFSLTIIYARIEFSNCFQILDLNKDITATATSQVTLWHLARLVTNHYGREYKDPDLHALRYKCSSFETALQRLVPLILSFNSLSLHFHKKQELMEKPRLACNSVWNRNRIQIRQSSATI